MNKIIKNMYFVSLFLVGLPSIFFIIPILNTVTLAKLIWLALFLLLVFHNIKKNKTLVTDKKLLILFLFFFLSQSLSILNSINLNAFLDRYEDFVFASLFFILSLLVIKMPQDNSKILGTLIASMVVNLFFQILMLLDVTLFTSFASFFLHPSYYEAIWVNIERGRIFLTTYDEAIIPLFFYFAFYGKNITLRLVSPILIFTIIIFSLLSGFRTKIIMTLFALLTTVVIFKKQFLRLLAIIAPIIFISYCLYLILPFISLDTGIGRIENTREDVNVITSGRLKQWQTSYEIGLSSPLFGVGLGNYYDNSAYLTKGSVAIIASTQIQRRIASQDPHNIFLSIFAETGILGLLSFTILLTYFIFIDVGLLKMGNTLSKVYILSFWTLFIFSLLNPFSAITYQALFWLFRAAIEAQRKRNHSILLTT